MTGSGARVVYEFGGYRLDPTHQQLISSADGRPVSLTPRVFQTLLYFVEHPGELLDKATLLGAIWPTVVVEENSLSQCISALRRTIGEDDGEHRFIVTIPGRGYRFVADVAKRAFEEDDGSAHAKPRPTHVATTPSNAPARTGPASVAVLPFANLTRDLDKEYFGDGMAEELIHKLARIPGLKVPARSSSFSYRGQNLDVRKIARALGVDAVLEGCIRSAGERIRVTAQLIDAATGFHIWSQSFDRQFEDLFRVQDELATAIAQALQPGTDQFTPPLVQAPPTRDLEAYHLYLRVLARSQRPDSSGERYAYTISLLEEAIRRDPEFARAHALRGFIDLSSIWQRFVEEPLWPATLLNAERHARRALALDPGLAEAHAVLAQICALRGDWLTAETHFSSGRSLSANDARMHLIYSIFLACTGYLRKALREALEAHRLAPALAETSLCPAALNSLLGRDADALRYADLAIALGVPKDLQPLPRVYSQAAFRAGRYPEAARYDIEQLPAALRHQEAFGVIESIYHALGNGVAPGPAIEALRKLIATGSAAGMESSWMVILSIEWYTMLGALDLAYATANAAVDRFQRFGTVGATWGGLWHREMLPLRRDARFAALAGRLGLMEYWNANGPPDDFEWRDGSLISK